MDTVGLIMAYEDGTLDGEGCLTLFSQLVKSGAAWSLQHGYGVTATALLQAGYIDENGNILKHMEAE